jgi:IS30 family transposase
MQIPPQEVRDAEASQPPSARRLLNDQEEEVMSYQQLTLDERYQIQALRKQQMSAAEISRRLGRHRSTITRELERNSTQLRATPGEVCFYAATQAQQRAATRRTCKGRGQRRITGALQQSVEQKLRLAWSPQQVSGRLWLEQGIRLSHETIYQHVLRDSEEQAGMLRYCLRFGGYKQHRFRKTTRTRSKDRKHHIDERPEGANDRSELGHWERDCVVGAPGGGALLTLVERKSRFSRIRRVSKLASDEVANATVDALRLHAPLTKSVTNDNGQEFGRDDQLESRLGVPIYFCDPSSPWQRGSIENLNGLIRQFVRKRSSIDALHPNLPQALEDTLNHRPRKTLGYRTPHEVLFATETKLMQGPLMRLGLEFSPPT